MKALILCAGRGTRLRPHTESQPKALVPVGPKAILEYELDAIRDRVDQIVIVTGYLDEQLRAHLGDRCTYVHNPDFATTNSLFSMLLAREHIDGSPFILFNGDLVVDPAVVQSMRDFVPLKVDQDSSEVFCERHNVEGLPLVLYLDGEGREIGRRMGLQESESLLESMQVVIDGYADYLEQIERAKEPDAAEAIASYLTSAGNPSGAVEILRRALKSAGKSPQAEILALLDRMLAWINGP